MVADLSVAQYVVWVAEIDLSDRLPRRFEGRVMLANRSGDDLYRNRFALGDLDDSVANANDMAEQIDRIIEKVANRR